MPLYFVLTIVKLKLKFRHVCKTNTHNNNKQQAQVTTPQSSTHYSEMIKYFHLVCVWKSWAFQVPVAVIVLTAREEPVSSALSGVSHSSHSTSRIVLYWQQESQSHLTGDTGDWNQPTTWKWKCNKREQRVKFVCVSHSTKAPFVWLKKFRMLVNTTHNKQTKIEKFYSQIDLFTHWSEYQWMLECNL